MYPTAFASTRPSSICGESNTALCLAVSRANHESSQWTGAADAEDGAGLRGAGMGVGAVEDCAAVAAGDAHAAPARTIADAATWPMNSRRC
jgi:hypothetical protein